MPFYDVPRSRQGYQFPESVESSSSPSESVSVSVSDREDGSKSSTRGPCRANLFRTAGASADSIIRCSDPLYIVGPVIVFRGTGSLELPIVSDKGANNERAMIEDE